jgi:hypothetical protein
MSDVSLTQTVQDCCQDVLRTALASRDALMFAASARVDDDTLRRFCRAVADHLGGQAAELSQLLVAHGCRPLSPGDERLDRLRATLVATLQPPERDQAAAEKAPRAPGRAAVGTPRTRQRQP